MLSQFFIIPMKFSDLSKQSFAATQEATEPFAGNHMGLLGSLCVCAHVCVVKCTGMWAILPSPGLTVRTGRAPLVELQLDR